MFGQMGQLASILKNAGQIKENMKLMHERLRCARFVGEAGGGQVKATVDGRGELTGIKIDPLLMQGGDIELVEDLVCGAVRAAIALSRESVQKEMEVATGGLNLQGVMDMLGQ